MKWRIKRWFSILITVMTVLMSLVPMPLTNSLADIEFTEASDPLGPIGGISPMGAGIYTVTFITVNAAGDTYNVEYAKLTGVGGDITTGAPGQVAPAVPARSATPSNVLFGVASFTNGRWAPLEAAGTPASASLTNIQGNWTFYAKYDVVPVPNLVDPTLYMMKVGSYVVDRYLDPYDGFVTHEHAPRFCYTTGNDEQQHQHFTNFRIHDLDQHIGSLDGATEVTSFDGAPSTRVIQTANNIDVILKADQHYYIGGWKKAEDYNKSDPPALNLNNFPATITECRIYYPIFVTQIPIMLEPKSATYVYDGVSHQVTGFDAYPADLFGNKIGTTPLGITVTGPTTNQPSLIDVGTADHIFNQTVAQIERNLRNGVYTITQNGVDVTREYWCAGIGKGLLEITPRSITITAVTESKAFNENYQYPRFTVNWNGSPTADAGLLIQNDAADYTGAKKGIVYLTAGGYGRAIWVGDYPIIINPASVQAALGAKYGNYVITYVPGVFSITNRTNKPEIWVQANDDTKTFNGQLQVSNNQGAKAVNSGGTLLARLRVRLAGSNGATLAPTYGEGTHVGDYPIEITTTLDQLRILLVDPDNPSVYVDVTEQYNIRGLLDGTLKILPPGSGGKPKMIIDLADVTEVFNTMEHVYNINESNIVSVTVAGSGLTYTITFTSTARGTAVGDYPHGAINNLKIIGKDKNGIEKDVTNDFDVEWRNGVLHIIQGELRTLTITAEALDVYYTGNNIDGTGRIKLNAQQAAASGLIGTSFDLSKVTSGDNGYLVTGHYIVIEYDLDGAYRLPGTYNTARIVKSVKIYSGDPDAGGTELSPMELQKLYNIVTRPNYLKIWHRDEFPPALGGPVAPLPLVLQVGNDSATFNGREQTGYADVQIAGSGYPAGAKLSLTGNQRVVGFGPGTGKGTWIGTYPTTLTTAGRNGLKILDEGYQMHMGGDYAIVEERPGVFEIKTNGGTGNRPALTITPGDVERFYTAQWITVNQDDLNPLKPTLSTNDSSIVLPPAGSWTHNGTFKASSKGITPGSYDVVVDDIGNLKILVPRYVNGAPTSDMVDYAKEYNVQAGKGKFTIRDRNGGPNEPLFQLTIAGNRVIRTYDGSIHIVTETTPGFTITVSNWPAMDYAIAPPNNQYVSGLTALGQGSAPKDYYEIVINASGYQVFHDGKNVTKNYVISRNTPGQLAVMPPSSKLNLVLTSPDQTFAYSGEIITANWAHSDPAATKITAASGLPEKGSFTAAADAKGHLPNTSPGYPSALTSIKIFTVEGVDVTQYYNVNQSGLGKLFIRHRTDQDTGGGKFKLDVYLTDKSADYTGDVIDVNDPLFAAIPVVDNTKTITPHGEKVTTGSKGHGRPTGTYPISMDGVAKVEVEDKLNPGVWANVTDSYTLTDKGGTLTIKERGTGNKIQITFQAAEGVGVYNYGLPVTVTVNTDGGKQVLAAGQPNLTAGGFTYTMNASGTASAIGITPDVMNIIRASVSIKDPLYKDGSGNPKDVTANYEITLLPNSIELIAKPTAIVLHSTPDHKDYTGKLLSVSQTFGSGLYLTSTVNMAGFTITYGNATSKDDSAAQITGYAEGVIPNTPAYFPGGYPIEWDAARGYKVWDASGKDVTVAFSITEDFAPFIINPLAGNNRIPITLQAENDLDRLVFTNAMQNAYNGLPVARRVKDMTVPEYFSQKDVVVDFTADAAGSGLLAGYNYPITVSNAKVFWIDGAGKEHDVTEYYNIDKKDGIFRIRAPGQGDPKPKITLTGKDASRWYTGTLITVQTNVDTNLGNVTTNAKTSGSGVVSGVGYALPVQGGYTLTVQDVAKGVSSNAARDWFDITEVPGTLTILTRGKPVPPGVPEPPEGPGTMQPINITLKPDDASTPFTGLLIPIDLRYGVSSADPRFTAKMVRETSGYVFDMNYVKSITANAHGEGMNPSPPAYPITIDNTAIQIMVGSGPLGQGTPANMKENYTITFLTGELTITKRTGNDRIPITLKAPLYVGAYTGDPYGPSTQIDNASGHSVSLVSGSLPAGSAVGSVEFTAFTTVFDGVNYPTDYYEFNAETETSRTYKDNIHLDEKSVKIFGTDKTGTQDVTDNYIITVRPNDLIIEKAQILELRITIGDIIRPYTGNPIPTLPSTDIQLTASLTNGPPSAWKPWYQIEYVNPVYDQSLIVPGTYADWLMIAAKNIRIIDVTNMGKNIAGMYKITVVPGKLTITPRNGNDRLPLTLRPSDGSLPFTGYMQTFTTTGNTVVAGQANVPTGASIVTSATGQAQTVGKHTGAVAFTGVAKINYTQYGVMTDLASNYNITLQKADLTITPPASGIPMTMTALDKEVPFRPQGYYGDLPESKVGVTAAMSGNPVPSNYDITGTIAYGEGIDPAAANQTKVITPKVLINGIDHTQYFNITRIPGIFTIRGGQNIPIKVWPKDQSVPYNAKDQIVKSGFDRAELVSGGPLPAMRITINATGKGNLPGTYDINIDMNGTVPDVKIEQLVNGVYVDLTAQYEILPQKAKLTITRRTGDDRIPITLKAPRITVPYTGDPYDLTTQIDNAAGFSVIVASGSLPAGKTADSVEFTAHTTMFDGKNYPKDYYETDAKAETSRNYKNNIVLYQNSIKIFGSDASGTMDVTNNYFITLEPNDLIIENREPLGITITIGDLVRPYTGNPIPTVPPSDIVLTSALTSGPSTAWKPWYRIEYLNPEYDQSLIVPGTYPGWITIAAGNIRIIDTRDNGKNIAGMYKITVVPGKLTITPRNGNDRLPLTLRPSDGSLPFTGYMQTFTTTGNTVVAGQANVPTGASIVTSATGQAQTVGKHTGAVAFTGVAKINYTQYGVMTDLAPNYNITLQKADLTITPPASGIPMTMTALDKEVPFRPQGYYGDLPESRVGVTAAMSGNPVPSNYDITGTIAYGEGIDPAVANQTKVITPKVLINGIDHTQYFDITRIPGIFTIRGGQNIPINVWPKDQSLPYNAKDQIVKSGFDRAALVSGGPLPAMRITINATGKGNLPGPYDINIDMNGTVPDVKIEQLVNGVYVDLTAQYKINPQKAKLTITPVSIPIEVSVAPQPELTYNKTLQGTAKTFPDTGVTGYEGVYTVGGGFAPLLLITPVQGDWKEINAGAYPIPAEGNVKIFGYVDGILTDITSNFTITSHDGGFKIKPYVLTGWYKAPDPANPEVEYGDPIVIPQTDHSWSDIDFFPGDDPPLCVDWVVELENGDQNAGIRRFVPRIIKTDPNYDSTNLVPLPSDQTFLIRKARLIVKPLDTERAQRGPNPKVLEYTATGMKRGETPMQTGFNPKALTFSAQEGVVEIGTWLPITNIKGPELTNYDVTYLDSDPDGGIQVYGQVYVYANYPLDNPLYIRPEKYYDPDDKTFVGTPEQNGFYRENLEFRNWTVDAAGDLYEDGQPFGTGTLDVYAHWTQLYELTVKHIRLDEGTEIAPPDKLWLAEYTLHQFKPVKLEGFTPIGVEYTVYGQLHMNGPTSVMIMPGEDVEATIEYVYKEPAEGEEGTGVSGGGANEDGDGGADGVNGYGYWIIDQLVPLGGIGSYNMGICYE